MLYLQFGMFIPAGMPLPEKVTTSNEVKSGLRNWSFSNSFGQGKSSKRSFALSTKVVNFADIGRLTILTKPSNSPRTPAGSRYVSIKPMYL